MKTQKNYVMFFFLAFFVSSLIVGQSEASIYDNPKAVEALSKCLKETNATMYGAQKCGHCNHNKEYFGPYFRNIRFVDCRASRAAKQECKVEKVGQFPKWKFGNGNYAVRPHSIEEIASAAGCNDYVANALGTASYQIADSNFSEQKDTTSQNSVSSSVYGSKEELARCLKNKGVIFYGSPRCSHCDKQKAMFDGAFEKHLNGNFHNCKGSPKDEAFCFSKRTFPFPTWIQPSNGKRLPGPEKSLDLIASTFSCTLADRSVGSQKEISRASNKVVNSNVSTNTEKQNSLDNSFSSEELGKTENVDILNKSSNDPILNSEQTRPSSMVASSVAPSFLDREKALLEQKQEKLASCLVDKNITLYGVIDQTKGKPIQYKATKQQLNELGDAAEKIKIVDCSQNQAECSGILVYPTWIFDGKNELAGVYELNNLAQILGCPIE
ncbi:MAG: hypothetical protein QNJ31_00340 [Candidatus Caenarcaniphilales bacterium]|nr:hypothetical protein [Candidatus Caenarcaniphilales bacterium]